MNLLKFIVSMFMPSSALIASEPSVATKYGKIIGKVKYSAKGRPYRAFMGIPYAMPPVGSLRFEDPVAVNPWSLLRATEVSPECLQYSDVPPPFPGKITDESPVTGVEDCLYLNIYAPELKNKTKKLPVIFFIHGGSFQYASGSMFGAKFLMDSELIFVTVNYRLGALGFLSTEDGHIPGNMGLKDQSMALRWIYENIEQFGGDNSKITLIGFSAGGSSVQYHYVSPLSRGLFHSGIAMSGTVVNPWGFALDLRNKAIKMGTLMNCPTDDVKEMVECLKRAPGRAIASATRDYQVWEYNPEAPFAPAVEKKCTNSSFICKSPKEIFDAGEHYDVPLVFGSTSAEGCSPVAEFALNDILMKEVDENWNIIAPQLLEYNYTISKDRLNYTSQEIRKEYIGRGHFSVKTGQQLIKIVTDGVYLVQIEEAIRMQIKKSKAAMWLYYYSYRPCQSFSNHLSGSNVDFGSCHTDDMSIVVENPFVDPTLCKRDLQMQQFLIKMWSSVAQKGVPEVGLKWQPLSKKDVKKLKFLHIRYPGNYSMSSSQNFGNKMFWKKLLNV